MPRRSSILDAPNRAAVDDQILRRDRSLRRIAAEAGLPYPALKRYARKLRANGARPDRAPETMGAVETFERAFGFPAMPHQVTYLEEMRPTLVRKGRQVGMTHAASGLAIYTARSRPGSTSVVISPSLRQSSEVTARARLALWALGEDLAQDSVSLLRTAAGSRIISLPGSARGIRGYACELVILDEAAWISDETWAAARPLVSATGGRPVAQSTPGLPAGWFYELATNTPAGWARIVIRSDEVPTISAAFLASERASMTPELYAQEYEATFGTALGGGALFTPERIAGLVLPRDGAAS
jgi:hypothetical protein